MMNWKDSTIKLDEIEVGFFVYDKKTSTIVRIQEIIDSDTVKLELFNEPRTLDALKPALITASRMSCFGFGKFNRPYEEVLYHEPVDTLYSEEDFYGELGIPPSSACDNANGLTDGYLILEKRDGGKLIDNEVNYIHQVQKNLRKIGCMKLSYGSGFKSTLSSPKTLEPVKCQ